MIEQVLYYPYIRVPQSDWFTRVLLYWDSVGSIVPEQYVWNPEQLGPYMQKLSAEGLVTWILPKNHIHRVPNFEEAFIDFAAEYKRKYDRSKRSLRAMHTYKVHFEKVDRVAKRLCELGLASKADPPWYKIEAGLASIFMAYLASALGKLPEINAKPITDTVSQLEIFQTKDVTRTIILDRLLPAPNLDVSPAEIARFKSAHRQYLIKFRNHIEQFILQVAAVPDSNVRKDMITRFLTNAQDDIEGIVDLMKSRGWTKVSLGRLLSYAVAATTLTDAVLSGGLVSILAAAFGVGSTAYTTYQDMRLPGGFGDSCIAYAALARKKTK